VWARAGAPATPPTRAEIFTYTTPFWTQVG
jgi:hypothetical protein